MKNKFVLSRSHFKSIKDAEKKVTQWWKEGTLKDDDVKLYKIVETYELGLKFIKKKKD